MSLIFKILVVGFFSFVIGLLSCTGDKKKVNSHSLKDQRDHIDTAKFYPANSKDSIQAIYRETAKHLWQTYVPQSSQSFTKQGEYIRILEKLDHEIRGNAKANWDEQFVLLANSLRDGLLNSKIFPTDVENEIKNDIHSLTKSYDELYLEDDLYDRLTRRIVEWFWRHKEPIPHIRNPELFR